MSDPVLCHTHICANGQAIGIATLNAPQALNAFSLDMIRLLSRQLQEWAEDERIALVLLQGSGDKAFCAGGDVRSLYHAIVAAPDAYPNPHALAFFSAEYSIYRQIYHYPKPVLVWSNGWVMGGGLGLTAVASHRVVNETTRMAMPEISIGLYPDACGSWFLQRMPAKTGLFLGLTGARFNGRDAALLNLADYSLPQHQYPDLLERLRTTAWQTDARANHLLLSQALKHFDAPDRLPESHIMPHWQTIHGLINSGSLKHVAATLTDTDWQDDWLQQAADTFAQGSPTSAALTWTLFERLAHASLAQCLYTELIVSLNCCALPDFREGVRALLVDKDKQPQWCRPLAQIDDDWLARHFRSPFPPQQHPFQHWPEHAAAPQA